LSPNALKAFRVLGVEAGVLAIGYQDDYQVIRSWRSGRVISRQKRSGDIAERFGASFVTIHRADLANVLLQALPERSVQLGKVCTGVESSDSGASARFADSSTIEADVVVGADGIRSAVRESLFGPDAPRFTGCVCWRGLVPVEALPANSQSREMTAWWGPHGHVVHYLVRRGELVNFVAHYDSDAWTGESWTHECDRSELMATYAGWHESLMRLFESSERYYKWALYDRDPLDRWGKGRATLLGDAAHPMLPYLGQGACMAIEDGCILADRVRRMSGDLTSALRDYERLRMPRTRQAQLGSRQRAKENHLVSPWARFWRDARFAYNNHFGADRTALRAAWLYDYDVAADTA
jgi:salicylate hydroxylase